MVAATPADNPGSKKLSRRVLARLLLRSYHGPKEALSCFAGVEAPSEATERRAYAVADSHPIRLWVVFATLNQLNLALSTVFAGHPVDVALQYLCS